MTRPRRRLARARPESQGDDGEELAKYQSCCRPLIDPHKIGAGLVGLPVSHLQTDAQQDWTDSNQLISGAIACSHGDNGLTAQYICTRLGVHGYPVWNLPFNARLDGFPCYSLMKPIPRVRPTPTIGDSPAQFRPGKLVGTVALESGHRSCKRCEPNQTRRISNSKICPGVEPRREPLDCVSLRINIYPSLANSFTVERTLLQGGEQLASGRREQANFAEDEAEKRIQDNNV
ncbi:hypothetical protein FB45DRAFT_934796 [Roridomyces roridus]|uniref:Uncharacterized protein n=1 Tax=Roridomyces roridus TaxID=1738132 RepID=A0AAD7BAV2_9AGAR|nr:hypothetical protein FB45DRAFT_934796 [Roridomyces roridus]